MCVFVGMCCVCVCGVCVCVICIGLSVQQCIIAYWCVCDCVCMHVCVHFMCTLCVDAFVPFSC